MLAAGAEFPPLFCVWMQIYSKAEERHLFASLRFVWNATRGYRLSPWRSPYLRWRIETYTGLHADQLTLSMIARFMWQERGELVRYLIWIARLDREVRSQA